MEMLQRRADQRKSHVFSTAGRSEVLTTNSVPEGPQRDLRQSVRVLLCLFFMHAYIRVCVCNNGLLCSQVLLLGEMYEATYSSLRIIKKHSYHALYAAVKICPYF